MKPAKQRDGRGEDAWGRRGWQRRFCGAFWTTSRRLLLAPLPSPPLPPPIPSLPRGAASEASRGLRGNRSGDVATPRGAINLFARRRKSKSEATASRVSGLGEGGGAPLLRLFVARSRGGGGGPEGWDRRRARAAGAEMATAVRGLMTVDGDGCSDCKYLVGRGYSSQKSTRC
ncbi:hypothetical protein R5R35_011003 [Gryllus longicercus]|uniref:Uncharacterized protein n=1 Tax=Gryllus longicercus TaxID=2509291 RepID=A0AAN9VE03_9ORTH